MAVTSMSTWERIRRRTCFWFGVGTLLAVPMPAALYLLRYLRGSELLILGPLTVLYVVIGVGFVRRALRPPSDPFAEPRDR